MDFFSIGTTLQTAMQMYSQVARTTGRTTKLLNILKDGDRVVFINETHVQLFQNQLRERNLKTTCTSINPRYPEQLLQRAPCSGQTYFDHVWVEEFYKLAIERASVDIDYFQNIHKDVSN
jgi:hypothetical protein